MSERAAAYVEWYGKARIQTWTTPRTLFDELHARYQFTLDGAASHGNALLPRYATAAEPVEWAGERVFCNPPWSLIKPFVDLAPFAELAVLLVPARVNSRWFHRALGYGARVEFFLGRPKFGTGAIANSPVDCLLLKFGAGAV